MSGAINTDGEYIKDENGRVLRSSHPAYRARVEIELPKGSWLHAPGSGHNLESFKNKKKTPVNEEEFEKEVNRYLSSYPLEIKNRVTNRDYFKATVEIEGES